jgi:tetratricopeptide (TPR) repeat protein
LARSLPGFESLKRESPPGVVEADMQELPERPASDAAKAPPSAADQVIMEARQAIKRRQYDQALQVLNSAQPLLKDRAEAFLLIGNILERKKDYSTARDFYNAALKRDPFLADAYWGFATASESLGDLESALGGMRSYLHTEPDPDPMRLRINQARSAIWEWETRLGRGPWGPTKGIPPGFIAEDLKRDGRGVGVKWPREDTLQPDGTMKSEIKSAEKVKIYPRP